MKRTSSIIAVALTVLLLAVLCGQAWAAYKNASGKVTMLRVHEVQSKYGPSSDELDAEVVFKLDSLPNLAFGFKLRNDSNLATHQGMLDLLRDAFKNGDTVYTDYTQDAEFPKKNCEVSRIWITK